MSKGLLPGVAQEAWGYSEKLLIETREITPAVGQPETQVIYKKEESFAVIVITTPLGKQSLYLYQINKKAAGDFPGGPGVKTLPSRAEGTGSIPGGGAETLACLTPGHKNKTEAML